MSSSDSDECTRAVEDEPPSTRKINRLAHRPARPSLTPLQLATIQALAVIDEPPPSPAAAKPRRNAGNGTNGKSRGKTNGKTHGKTTNGKAPGKANGKHLPASRTLRVDARHADPAPATTAEPPVINQQAAAFRRQFFPDASDHDWDSWRWQSQHRIRTLDHFERMITLSDAEREALERGGTMLPVGITPYYMSLIDPVDPAQPLRKTVVPTTAEFVRTDGEADDPLGEDGHSPVPGLVHRYPDRVLFLPLDFCSTYCRYCTRSRVVGHGEIVPNEARLEAIYQYLEETTQVRDVLISGGDPLALSDDKLDGILGRLRAIPHIEFVRIGTKMPAVLPQRITPELCAVLRKYHPLWMSLHFLHPSE